MMRPTVSRAAAVLAAVLATATLAACGTQPAATTDAGGRTPPSASQDGQAKPSAIFETRARQVTARWDRSQATRAWRTGLVLLDPSELVPIPRNEGFASQEQKDAFGSGHFRLAGTLPAEPLPGLVRWAGGATIKLPLLTARAAFAELAAQRPCGGPDPCGELTVTGAQPATVTVLTSRGPASVPAWRFTVTGLGWPVSEVAVAPGALVVLPGYGPIPPAGRNTPGVSELAAVSKDGRTLTVQLLGGACDAAWGTYSYETGRAVVVGSWARQKAGHYWCAAVGILRTARVTLKSPLGTRVVLDVATGLPLVPQVQIP
jgi:hypothetical protein